MSWQDVVVGAILLAVCAPNLIGLGVIAYELVAEWRDG